MALSRAATESGEIPEDLRSPSPTMPVYLLVPVGTADLDQPGRLEPVLDAAAGRGLVVVARVLEETWPSTAQGADAVKTWVDRVGAFARRAGPRVAAYQVFEAPAGGLAARDYAFLLKSVVVLLRSARPGVGVLLGALPPGDTAWAEALLTGDLPLYFDILAARDAASLPFVTDVGSRLAPRAPVWVAGAAIDPRSPAASIAWAYLEAIAAGARNVLFAAVQEAPEGSAAQPWSTGAQLVRLRELFPPGLSSTTEAALPFDAPEGPARRLAFFDPGRQEGALAYRAVLGEGRAADEGAAAAPPTDMIRMAVRSPLEYVDLIDPLGGASRRIAVNVRRGAVLAVALRNEYYVLKYRFMAAPPTAQAQVGATTELTAEEIIARERVTQAAQDARLKHYEADVTIAIHYRITGLNESVDVVTENRLFVHEGVKDYEQTEMFVNGARWRGKSPPYLPFLQPEKVKELPLDIALDEAYRYTLDGRERVDGHDCYVLSFEPKTAERSLYQGRVYIDSVLFNRVKMDAVQNGLQDPLRSNQVVFHLSPVPSDGGEFWLPVSVSGQMIFEVLGQNLVVEREATYANFIINREGFRGRVADSHASGRPLFRETDEGYYGLEIRDGQERLTTASTPRNVFLVMGANVGFGGSPGLPFAGVNFFDFDFKGTGTQFDLAWAGPFADISWTIPNLGDRPIERRPLALTFQGSFNALSRRDKIARESGTNSGETLNTYRQSVRAALAIPMGHFAKWTVEGRASWARFTPAKETADDFDLPQSMIESTALLRLEYDRIGYIMGAWGEAGRRSHWDPWGLPGAPFSTDDGTFTRLGVDLTKSFYFGAFRKVSLTAQGFDGRGLDRFSRFELGDFRSARVHGFNGSGIHFDRGLVTRAAYNFTLRDTVRIGVNLEQGWIQSVDDFGAGYERVAGADVGFQFSGPWSTLANVTVSRGISSTIPGKGGGGGDIRVVFFRTFNRWGRQEKIPDLPR